MSFRKIKWTSIAFVLVLALSGASFGFLLGRSHSASLEKTSEQLHNVSEKVQTSGAVVSRGADALRRLLVR
ncbi:MAG: hypothetical protein AAFZ52_04695 [Bacteroidota bacterium]